MLKLRFCIPITYNKFPMFRYPCVVLLLSLSLLCCVCVRSLLDRFLITIAIHNCIQILHISHFLYSVSVAFTFRSSCHRTHNIAILKIVEDCFFHIDGVFLTTTIPMTMILYKCLFISQYFDSNRYKHSI